MNDMSNKPLRDDPAPSLPLLAAQVVVRDYASAEENIGRLIEQGTQIDHIRETLIQVYLFDGYPTALEGLILLDKAIRGESNPPPPEKINGETVDKWLKRGESACSKIYGENYRKLRRNVRRLSPDLEQWMILEGYGKVLSRDSLDLRTRELVNIAVLAVKNYPRQLHSHLRGALNLGVTETEIESTLRILAKSWPEKLSQAFELWDRIKLKNE